MPNGGAVTPDEQRETLDQQLDASLSAFDAMLIKEQQAVAEQRAEQGGATPGGAGGGAGDGEGGYGGASGGRAGEHAETATAAQAAGEQESDGAAGTAAQGSDEATGSSRDAGARPGGRQVTAPAEGEPPTGGDDSLAPPDVGDGRDDDVVARQLREAAMNEKDPAIRERLWDEYRKYKKGRGGGS